MNIVNVTKFVKSHLKKKKREREIERLMRKECLLIASRIGNRHWHLAPHLSFIVSTLDSTPIIQPPIHITLQVSNLFSFSIRFFPTRFFLIQFINIFTPQ
jgi:hypothetical protein